MDAAPVTIPDPEGPLFDLLVFALTYDAYARLAHPPENLARLVSPVTKALAKTGEPPPWAGVDLLRGTLFWIQRKTHHWGDVPAEEENQMRTLVRAIAKHSGGRVLVEDYNVC